MFAPPNYVPATRLWDQFSSARLNEVYRKAAQGYAKEDFYSAFSRGSPLDICEHIFFIALSEIGVSLASKNGWVVDVHTRYRDGLSGLFWTLPPIEAAGAIWNLSRRKGEKQLEEAALNGQKFAAWKFKSDDNSAFTRVYPQTENGLEDLSSPLRYHSLPALIVRETFSIVSEMPPWLHGRQLSKTDLSLVDNFRGRSICVAETKLDEVWGEYVDGSRLPYRAELETLSGEGKMARGRPKKYEKSRAFWAGMRFDRGDRSWHQTEDFIEKQTGERPTAKTLRDWKEKAQGSTSPRDK